MIRSRYNQVIIIG